MTATLDEEASTRFFNHVLDMWIRPEMERRIKEGKAPENFEVTAAQVVSYADGRPHFIRLNDEVKAILIGIASRGIKVNEKFVLEDGLKEIKEIQLSNRDDPNAGHVTFLLFRGQWIMSFDFRYNKEKSRARLETAIQFLSAAKNNHEEGLDRPCVDNMYSAIELLATAQLLLYADKEYSKRQHHAGTEKRYIAMADIGNYKIEYKETLLELKNIRKSARYLAKDFQFSSAEADRFMKIIEDMTNYTKRMLM